MTPEQADKKLRFKIAFLDGYKLIKEGRKRTKAYREEVFIRAVGGVDKEMQDWLLEQVTPDYLNDEHAMQRLEATIPYDDQPYYLQALRKRLMKSEGVSEFEMVNAIARVRALAYVDFRTRIRAWTQ